MPDVTDRLNYSEPDLKRGIVNGVPRRLALPIGIMGLLALCTACTSERRQREPPRAEAPVASDSAGWRQARLAQGRLELRYPESLVAGVVDRSDTSACAAPPAAAIVDDTTLTGRLVVMTLSVPLDGAAAPLGFTRREDGWWTDPTEPNGWTGGVQADSFSTNGWAGLFGEVTMKVITDDQAPATPDERVMPRDLHQARLVALRPLRTGCALVLLWWGGEYFEDDTAAHPEARRALFQHLLAGARVRTR